MYAYIYKVDKNYLISYEFVFLSDAFHYMNIKNSTGEIIEYIRVYCLFSIKITLFVIYNIKKYLFTFAFTFFVCFLQPLYERLCLYIQA